MNGNKFLLDTNAIAALLQGNATLVELLKTADWVGISIISQLEFLANPALNADDRVLFDSFLNRVQVIDLAHHDTVLLSSIIKIRTTYRLKLPDSIIAASALQTKAILLTADGGFRNIKKLKVLSF
jgi:tRNA(fMet)-specific endonuclease VapC